MVMPDSIEEVLRRHEPELLQKANVTSVGIGEEQGERFIIVFVREKVAEEHLLPEDVVPPSLEGYRVDVRQQLLIG